MSRIRTIAVAAVTRGHAVLLAVGGMTLAAGSLAAGEPSFDCHMAGTEIEKHICDSAELAELDRMVARRYEALGKDIRSKPLSNGIVADQRAWLGEREACGQRAGADKRETCLRDAYRHRADQLDFHRAVLVGPPLPRPPALGCEQTAGSQVEIRDCLSLRSTYVSRALKVATEAAPAEMRELDAITSADIGAEMAYVKSRQTYEPYRDAACAAVAASYAGGSGAGIAELSCRTDMDWDRANQVASRFLFRPVHWSEALDTLAAPIGACLKAAEGKGSDPRVTGVIEAADGGQRIRVAAGDGWRGECATTPDRKVTDVSDLDGDDIWPDENLAVFYPRGSLKQPPFDPCSLYRWVATHDGDLAGWVRLALCR